MRLAETLPLAKYLPVGDMVARVSALPWSHERTALIASTLQMNAHAR